MRISLLLVISLLLQTGVSAQTDSVARAEELLDAGDAPKAIVLLDGLLQAAPEDARALLLRSTARFYLGERESGEADLRRALALDPSQRQGWLNLAALELSDANYDVAYENFVQAQKLDPEAVDNHLNLGAALLFAGRLEESSEHFQKHLARPSRSGDDYYLVATNYAMAGYSALAMRHLSQAVQLDEKVRLRARTDSNFARLAETPGYQSLLETDVFVPPPGSLTASHTYSVPYSSDGGRLVGAILNALTELRLPYDRRVEVTPAWTLIWADIRIKAGTDSGTGRGLVFLSAPAASFTPQSWHQREDALFRQIEIELEKNRAPLRRFQ